MQNDFIPIHLQQANAALDKHSLAPKNDHTYYKRRKHKRHKHKSLLQRFLGLFKK